MSQPEIRNAVDPSRRRSFIWSRDAKWLGLMRSTSSSAMPKSNIQIQSRDNHYNRSASESKSTSASGPVVPRPIVPGRASSSSSLDSSAPNQRAGVFRHSRQTKALSKAVKFEAMNTQLDNKQGYHTHDNVSHRTSQDPTQASTGKGFGSHVHHHQTKPKTKSQSQSQSPSQNQCQGKVRPRASNRPVNPAGTADVSSQAGSAAPPTIGQDASTSTNAGAAKSTTTPTGCLNTRSSPRSRKWNPTLKQLMRWTSSDDKEDCAAAHDGEWFPYLKLLTVSAQDSSDKDDASTMSSIAPTPAKGTPASSVPDSEQPSEQNSDSDDDDSDDVDDERYISKLAKKAARADSMHQVFSDSLSRSVRRNSAGTVDSGATGADKDDDEEEIASTRLSTGDFKQPDGSIDDPTQAKTASGDSKFETNKQERALEHEHEILKTLGITQPANGSPVQYLPAWLSTDVLLQGRIYLTTKELLYYGTLTGHDANEIFIAASLRLKTSGLRGSYVRYWFVLKSNQLCFYSNPSDTYFPQGIINLRDVEKVVQSKEDDTTFGFIMKRGRKIKMRADSSNSAHEWCKFLQKEVFRAQAQADNVVIRIPYDNIVCTVSGAIHDLAQTLRLTVLMGPSHHKHINEQDVHNYVFSFFVNGPETIASINKAIRDCNPTPKHHPKFAKEGILDFSTTKFGKVSTSVHDTLPETTRRAFGLTAFGEFVADGDAVATDVLYADGDNTNWGGHQLRTSAMENAFSRRSLDDMDSIASTPDSSRPPSQPPSGTASAQLSPVASSTRLAPSKHGLGKLEAPHLGKAVHKKLSSLAHEIGELKPFSAESLDDEEEEEEVDAREEIEIEEDDWNDPKGFVGADQATEHFQAHFALSRSTELIASYLCNLKRNRDLLSAPLKGKLYICQDFVCFRAPGGLASSEVRMMIPTVDIGEVLLQKDDRIELVVAEAGAGKLLFDFRKPQERDIAGEHIKREATAARLRRPYISDDEQALRTARMTTYERSLGERLKNHIPPVIFDNYTTDFEEHFLTAPMQQMHITMLTIGSRGDVQPYIAMALGLQAEGHKCRIATHGEFRKAVEGYGIEFREVAGDPAALMSIMIEHGGFSVSMLKEAASKFRSWVAELLQTAWEACKDTDLLIESPSAMAGLHIAEALQIPYIRAFTMPWTRTHEYPHAFIVPNSKMGGSYNYFTYVMFDNLFWKGISKQVNHWRKHSLGIPATNLEGMQQQEVPFMYCVSPSVLVPPLDMPDWIHITGYWQIPDDKEPAAPDDQGLIDFIAKTKSEGKKLVYIGFGSIVVNDAEKMTAAVVGGVEDSGVRCILARGWSQRNSKGPKSDHIHSDSIYEIDAIEHPWLFPQVDAVVHHGGSGTTGSGLRFGRPTIIKPFFGDQFFYAQRVEDLGVGIHLAKINRSELAKALTDITSDPSYTAKARLIGEQISSENGVKTGIKCIYRELPYARVATQKRTRSGAHESNSKPITEFMPQLPLPLPGRGKNSDKDSEKTPDKTPEKTSEKTSEKGSSHSLMPSLKLPLFKSGSHSPSASTHEHHHSKLSLPKLGRKSHTSSGQDTPREEGEDEDEENIDRVNTASADALDAQRW